MSDSPQTHYMRDKKLTEWCNSDLKAAEANWPMHSLTENTESIVLFAFWMEHNQNTIARSD